MRVEGCAPLISVRHAVHDEVNRECVHVARVDDPREASLLCVVIIDGIENRGEVLRIPDLTRELLVQIRTSCTDSLRSGLRSRVLS